MISILVFVIFIAIKKIKQQHHQSTALDIMFIENNCKEYFISLSKHILWKNLKILSVTMWRERIQNKSVKCSHKILLIAVLQLRTLLKYVSYFSCCITRSLKQVLEQLKMSIFKQVNSNPVLQISSLAKHVCN